MAPAVYTPGIGWQYIDATGEHGNYETEAEALRSLQAARDARDWSARPDPFTYDDFLRERVRNPFFL